ncbi:MAG: DegT/DnrJ/EryC1/StrS family aminotransferase [Planctomycetota bacterium]
MSSESIPLSRPDITQAEIDAVLSVLRTDRLSIGPKLESFEAAVAERVGRKHGIGVNSGTSGLHLCVKSLGISDGDEVITTPFSFIATTNAILFDRAKPVFVDIDPHSYNMDPSFIEGAITERTKAIMPVEVFGNMAHFPEYERIARTHNLLLIEDCCEALGGRLGGRAAGSFGECGVFAFYPNKQITTGEGGVIVTDRGDIANMCRALRNQGRFREHPYTHKFLGHNYRMGEMTAALGEAQMRRLEEILQKRRKVAETYHELLADVAEVHLPNMAEPKNAGWFVYVVRLADNFTEGDRNAIMEHLQGDGIGCNTYFVPIHLQPFVREMLGTKKGDFPQTERIAERTICLPFFTNLKPDQAVQVKKALLRALSAQKAARP